MLNDVVIGAWRHGLDKIMLGQVEHVEQRRNTGFRLLPYESTVSELALILDAYDEIFEELLTAEPACCMMVEEEAEKAPRKNK